MEVATEFARSVEEKMISLSHEIFELVAQGKCFVLENCEVQRGGSDPTALVLLTSKQEFCGRLGCVWQQGDVVAIKEIITLTYLVTELRHQTSM
jgi:hypothetical protein